MSLAELVRDRARRLAVERRVGALLRSPRTTRLVTRLIAATGSLHERLGDPPAWRDAARTRARASSQALRSVVDSVRRLATSARSRADRAGDSAGGTGANKGSDPEG